MIAVNAGRELKVQTGARARRGVIAMLRVTTLYAATAPTTAGYYTRYLTEASGEPPGQWLGTQADRLGLRGR